MSDHLPDITNAKAWLTDIARRLREQDAERHGGLIVAAAEGEQTLRDMAATLHDIVARANIVDRYRVELPTVPQANALARRGPTVVRIVARPFDLPPDYLLVEYEDGFTCGISPEGDVSS